MAINIIERAITPYNRSANKLTQKQGYSLYAPTVTRGKPGIATFSEEDFDVSGGKVGLKSSLKFIRLNHRNGVDNVPASECIFEVDGRKTPGVIYQNFVYEVASGFNTEPYLCSGYLFVTLNVDQDISGFINQTEVFFADGLMWMRLLRFEPDWTISGGVNSFELVRIPSWAKRDTKPQYTAGEVGAVSTQTFYESTANEQRAREEGDAAVNERITGEISAREEGDTAVNNRLTTELSSLETRMGEALQTYLSITQAADEEIRGSAVGIPTYDETTGKITFETLSGRYTTIDLILMSMLTNVRFDEANNEIVFTFRDHDGYESPVRVPLDNFTLPAWTTNVNTTNSEQLSVPPTTQAVKNAVSSEVSARQNADTALGTRINNEATSRGNADKAIKELAVKAPTLSNNVLIFKNLNDEEMTRITLPEGGGGGGSSGGSCSCYSVPIQKFEYTNENVTSGGEIWHTFTYTEVDENLLKAILHIAEPSNMNCGGFPSLVLSSDNPVAPEGVEDVYVAINRAYGSDTDTDYMSIHVSQTPPLSITFLHNGYFTPPNDWFIEITVKTDTREIWVVCQEMLNPYN